VPVRSGVFDETMASRTDATASDLSVDASLA